MEQWSTRGAKTPNNAKTSLCKSTRQTLTNPNSHPIQFIGDITRKLPGRLNEHALTDRMEE